MDGDLLFFLGPLDDRFTNEGGKYIRKDRDDIESQHIISLPANQIDKCLENLFETLRNNPWQ